MKNNEWFKVQNTNLFINAKILKIMILFIFSTYYSTLSNYIVLRLKILILSIA